MTQSDCFSDDRSLVYCRRENYTGRSLQIFQIKVFGGPYLGGGGNKTVHRSFHRLIST